MPLGSESPSFAQQRQTPHWRVFVWLPFNTEKLQAAKMPQRGALEFRISKREIRLPAVAYRPVAKAGKQ
jgi:hypothetical protein